MSAAITGISETTQTGVVRDALLHVAAALEYPDTGSISRIREGVLDVALFDDSLAVALSSVATWLEGAKTGEPEERYTGLFDLSPVCTLAVGYHLFGEAYQRGALLSGLVAEHRNAGVDTGSELADHLPNVLRLLAALPPGTERETLVDALLLPALTRMTESLAESKTPWADVIRALPAALAPLGGGAPLPPPERITDVDLEAEPHA